MAVSTINPWAAGAVVIDQRPFLQFYERQMAREQAKQDSLENYFKDLGKNITSTGMRSQDVPTLLQKNKEWQDHYMQNKAAILNPKLDNGAAYNKYMSGYQDQIALTNESKQAYKNKEELGKMKFNKDFSYVFDDPDIINKIALDDLPIGHPQRQPFDMITAALPPKPIGTKEKEEFSKYVLGDVKPDKIPGTPINVGNFQTQTPVTHQYSEQNKKIFGDRAADVYDTDRNWRANAVQTFKEVQHNPVLHDQLNAISKRYYGHDIDNPRDAFVAKTILDHDIKTIEYQKGEDAFGREKAMAAIHHGYSEAEIRLRDELKNKGEDEQNNIVDQRYEEVKQDALNNPRPYKPVKGEPYSQYSIKVTEPMKQMFAVKDAKGHLIYPDDLRYSKDLKYVVPVFYEHYVSKQGGKEERLPQPIIDANGNASVDATLSKPILESEFKERWKKELLGVQGYNKSLKTKAIQPASTSDWRSRAKKVE